MILSNYTVSNPFWVNAENSIIDCTLTEIATGNQFQFSANPLDSMDYGRQLFADLVKGVYGEIAPYELV